MSLNVKTRKVDGIVVVDMSGRLTIGEPVLLLRETLRVQVNDGARQFVLNLGDVSYIDSSGLGELVSAYTTVRNKQGDEWYSHRVFSPEGEELWCKGYHGKDSPGYEY